eukprot:CAMPEP_0179488748 /NCGR_PEP_ID=MMETSP0799-20121207/64290_1 /TAXON_ID=46947 /ORGANISM="Geminigera cryophila, Strain CCMP2564" /LENGTH=61 /DNA_ID=CAMNT_0021304293 /DNA_START=313 /DNA_END=498 /DNA_ORIENTATION=+
MENMPGLGVGKLDYTAGLDMIQNSTPGRPYLCLGGRDSRSHSVALELEGQSHREEDHPQSI